MVKQRKQRLPVGSRAVSSIVCPHCQRSGRVSTRSVKVKRGISGGKVAGAFVTSGVSILATGLSRKQAATAMHCGHCGVDWTIT